jgi:ribonuclease HI
MISIYTDGSCEGNPGRGGWAAIISQDGVMREIGGCEDYTTNNRMELTAVIEGLKQTPPGTALELYSDSQYVLRGIQKWLANWKRRGWRTAAGKPVENQDLWQELDRVAGPQVSWHWVRGHVGDPMNERANTLAMQYCHHAVKSSAKSHSTVTKSPATPTKVTDPSMPTITLGQPMLTPGHYPVYLSLVHEVLHRDRTWEQCSARVLGVAGARYHKVRSPAEEREVLIGWGLTP